MGVVRRERILACVLCVVNGSKEIAMGYFRQSKRFNLAPALLALGVWMAMHGPATARLHDLAPRFSSEYVTALHRPTGCGATLEFTNNILVAAFITDPLCLPQGVKARTIPAFPRDFHVPASKRQLLRVR